jgi:proteasome lid subunit RPN8/RPN11
MNDTLLVKQLHVPKQVRMGPQVFASICETIGTRPAETGGILGGNRQTGEVTHFFFDESPTHKTSVLYEPNTARLNDVKRNQWKPQGIAYLGSIHSHPPSYRRPSSGDEVSARRILEVLEIPYLLVPIVTTLPDTGSVTLYPFAAVLDEGRVLVVEQELVVGDTLIAPVKPAVPERSEDAQEYLAILMEMELSLNAMLYGGLPWAARPVLRQPRFRQGESGRLDYEYD